MNRDDTSNACLQLWMHAAILLRQPHESATATAWTVAVKNLRRLLTRGANQHSIMTGKSSMGIAFGVLKGVALLPFVKFYALQFAQAIWWGGDEAPRHEGGDSDNDDPLSGEEDEQKSTEDRYDAAELRRQHVQGQLDFSGLSQNLEQTILARLEGTFAAACDQLLGQRLDTGNQSFFQEWLDPFLQLSCAQYCLRSIDDLPAAQSEKMDDIARQLELKPGMRVLIIECGWGGLACYLAKHHGVTVTGISRQHGNIQGARIWAVKENVTGSTNFTEGDSSDLDETFDRIVCVAFSEINHSPSEHELSRLLCMNGRALVHRAVVSLSLLLEQARPEALTEKVVDITDAFAFTVSCWLQNLRRAWSLGKLQEFGLEKRIWEFTLCCLVLACGESSLGLQEVVYTKVRGPSHGQPKDATGTAISCGDMLQQLPQ